MAFLIADWTCPTCCGRPIHSATQFRRCEAAGTSPSSRQTRISAAGCGCGAKSHDLAVFGRVYEETNEREATQQCFLESCGVCVDPPQSDELDVPTLAPHGLIADRTKPRLVCGWPTHSATQFRRCEAAGTSPSSRQTRTSAAGCGCGARSHDSTVFGRVYEETSEREETQQCFPESCGVCGTSTKRRARCSDPRITREVSCSRRCVLTGESRPPTQKGTDDGVPDRGLDMPDLLRTANT